MGNSKYFAAIAFSIFWFLPTQVSLIKSFDDVPTEIHVQIIHSLPLKDLMNCIRVSKVWRRIVIEHKKALRLHSCNKYLNTNALKFPQNVLSQKSLSSVIKTFTNLEKLDLHETPIAVSIVKDMLDHLPALKSLSLKNVDSAIEFQLAKLTNLKSLWIFADIPNMKQLIPLSNLQTLNIVANVESIDIITQFFTNLTSLILQGNKLFKSPQSNRIIPSEYHDYFQMSDQSTNDDELNQSNISQFTNLKNLIKFELHLNDGQFDSKLIDALNELKNLKELTIENGSINDQTTEIIAKNFMHLLTLDLSHNKIGNP